MKTKNDCAKTAGPKRLFGHGLTLILFLVCLSCSKDDEEQLAISLDGPVLSVSDFAGNWTATNAIFQNFDGSQYVDIVEEGGSASLSVQANGAFSITLNIPDQGSEVISGKLGFNEEEYGDRLIVVFDGEPEEDYEVYNILLENGVLSLSGITTFDFTGNGTEVPAVIDLSLTRN